MSLACLAKRTVKELIARVSFDTFMCSCLQTAYRTTTAKFRVSVETKLNPASGEMFLASKVQFSQVPPTRLLLLPRLRPRKLDYQIRSTSFQPKHTISLWLQFDSPITYVYTHKYA